MTKGIPIISSFQRVTVIYSEVETRSTVSPVPSFKETLRRLHFVVLKSCLSTLPVSLAVMTISQRLVISDAIIAPVNGAIDSDKL